jgi:putative transposase
MRRKRCFLPTEVYFVTIRTVEERYALSPLACPGAWTLAEGRQPTEAERRKMNARGRECIRRTNLLTEKIAQFEQGEAKGPLDVTIAEFTNSIPNIIGGCLSRAVEKFGVQLYACIWMSNHGHLLLRAPNSNLPEFMTYLNGQIAVEVNRFLGRTHHLWGRRYSAAPVLDEEMELDLLAYVLTNPQNAGLTNSIENWPGLSSASFFLKNQKERFLRFDRTAWHEHGRPMNIAPFLSTTQLEHAVLPQLEPLAIDALREKISQLIRNRMKKQRPRKDTIAENNHKSAPSESISRQLKNRAVIPTDRPQSPARSPQPLCHTTKSALHERYKEWDRAFRVAYEDSAEKYKNGNIDVEFPPGSFAPSNSPAARYATDPDDLAILNPTRHNLELAAARAADCSRK